MRMVVSPVAAAVLPADAAMSRMAFSGGLDRCLVWVRLILRRCFCISSW